MDTLRYREVLERAPLLSTALPTFTPTKLSDLPAHLSLFDDGRISVVYAPVDYVNHDARLVVLGITPGWQQTAIAFQTAIEWRRASAELGQEIKRAAAFAGTMRINLVSMLDDLALPELLGIGSTAALFGEHADLLHSTSMLRYPVFRSGTNYSGHGPRPSEHAFLAAMLEYVLAPELRAASNALIIPLGKAVEHGLEYLTSHEMLAADRWLRGFPHPSGANGHRNSAFAAQKDALTSAARQWFEHSRTCRG